jgi:hypothetical protein
MKNFTHDCLAGMYPSSYEETETASDARKRNSQWITLSFRAPKIRQTVAAGAALAGVPSPQEQIFPGSSSS